MNIEQTFQLIDSLLPYEICSYHRILPLEVKGESLLLGMVNPDDVAILDYVRPILKPRNYFIRRHMIDNATHQKVLEQYRKQTLRAKLAAADNGEDSSPTLVFSEKQIVGDRARANAAATELRKLPGQTVSPGLTGLPVLEVQTRYATAPVLLLAQLPPHELVSELFGRSLVQQISQISFERSHQYGRIVWSKNNQSKVLLDKLPLPLFQGIIHELKRLTDFPVKPVTKPQKIEMLRQANGQPILLRMRFIPGPNGEQVALQIFRGKLLQSYQQSQMDKLAEELQQLMQSVEQNLFQLTARSQINPAPIPNLMKIKQELGVFQEQLDYIQANQIKF